MPAAQFVAELGSGQVRLPIPEFRDQRCDGFVRQAGRAGHSGIITENNGKESIKVVGGDQMSIDFSLRSACNRM